MPEQTPAEIAETIEVGENVNAALKVNAPAFGLSLMYAALGESASMMSRASASNFQRAQDLATANFAKQLEDVRQSDPRDAITLAKEMQAGLPSDINAFSATQAAAQQLLASGLSGSGLMVGAVPTYIQLLQRGVPSSAQAGAVQA